MVAMVGPRSWQETAGVALQEPAMRFDRRRCLTAWAGVGLGLGLHGLGIAGPMPRPALMEALDAPDGFDPRGWLVSEKFDGVRAFWDGQTLRFRSGAPITAPRWFTAALPATALDGELWAGRGQFETLVGTVRRHVPDDSRWRQVRYALFDQPGAAGPFLARVAALRELVARAGVPHLRAVEQVSLDGPQALQKRLQHLVAQGAEGLMLHRADAHWRPGRSADLRKLKPLADAEAVVVGHEQGQGRHAGRLGALTVQAPDGRRFRLGTGFSDVQRQTPPPLGAVVTYTHRGFTEAGMPRFASFLRVRALP